MKYLPSTVLYTDYYQLTMARGYWMAGKAEDHAVFYYYFRQLPFSGNFVIFAGLHDVLHVVDNYQFDEESLNYLSEHSFDKEFLDYLSRLRLTVDIDSVPEGQVVFPGEPLVTVSGPLLQCQLLETMLLNQINYQSLIATKAARIKIAAGQRPVMDFGLRRAQGLGGLQASRASYVGGLEATSNVWSAYNYEIPPSGTIAHSWIQSFDSELEAFRSYAYNNPDSTILLVDTYDTLNSGLPNAVIVGKELEKQGHRLLAVRLDSGNLIELTQKTRQILDEADLHYVKIAISDKLDEYHISELLNSGAPIDLFGVGTRLVTGHETPALDGVYKMCEINGKATFKRSDDPIKETLPGHKEVIRFFDESGFMIGDLICLAEEGRRLTEEEITPDSLVSNDLPAYDSYKQIGERVCREGVVEAELPSIHQSREHTRRSLQELPGTYKRLEEAGRYPVWISQGIEELKKIGVE